MTSKLLVYESSLDRMLCLALIPHGLSLICTLNTWATCFPINAKKLSFWSWSPRAKFGLPVPNLTHANTDPPQKLPGKTDQAAQNLPWTFSHILLKHWGYVISLGSLQGSRQGRARLRRVWRNGVLNSR